MASDLMAVFEKFAGIRKQMGNKVGSAFATGAQPSGGKETTIMDIAQALMCFGVAVVGDPIEATGHFGVASVGDPNEQISDYARKTGKRVAQLAQKLSA